MTKKTREPVDLALIVMGIGGVRFGDLRNVPAAITPQLCAVVCMRRNEIDASDIIMIQGDIWPKLITDLVPRVRIVPQQTHAQRLEKQRIYSQKERAG
ncbi:hypothetical protein TrVE_jg8704 [Triparma verrucosa]|uniref:Uncharacterized protein n=1 Tax=Triparma verrucosa TaxID=1606542 RepID=A0A9W7B017_9STRA|nr:hypothetical protein TrVE_jg8704 [Triparma verrucosa]